MRTRCLSVTLYLTGINNQTGWTMCGDGRACRRERTLIFLRHTFMLVAGRIENDTGLTFAGSGYKQSLHASSHPCLLMYLFAVEAIPDS